jgi:hypothetical protein
MTAPEDALDRARAAARAHADRYGEVPATRLGPPYDRIRARLSEWAVPDPSGYEIRSVRRVGAPITWLKRGLVRLLYQFHAQLIADQSRFNLLALNYVRSLEERIDALEAALAEAGTAPSGGPAPGGAHPAPETDPDPETPVGGRR